MEEITPVTIRFPADLHAAIKKRAKEGNRSFNSEVIYELRESPGQSQPQPAQTGHLAQAIEETPEITMEVAWKRYCK